ncbi:hypothetical protein A4U88_4746 [Serratia marcescens]|nr:hypothetical protein A4U88_4746 [Serratia marcescens]
MVRKVHLRLTLPLSNWRFPLIEKNPLRRVFLCLQFGSAQKKARKSAGKSSLLYLF